MNRTITQSLESWLAAGGARIGQVLIRNRFELLHADDAARNDLEEFTAPEDARFIAQNDDAGEFRPLKTAPTLRHGWLLRLRSAGEVRLALDYLYPAMVGTWFAFQREKVQPVPLRETLGRQSGMYAIAARISDEEARAVVTRVCGGCLKQRLWAITHIPQAALQTAPGELPLLCPEACALFIGAARDVVKKRPA